MIAKVPTIVIGLGGIGSEIVENVEIRTQDREHTYKKYVRENIQFVIMDTDENSIRERRRNGYQGYSVTLSGDVSVGKCLEWDVDARENWYPEDNIFRSKSIAEGAGQVRSISRLAFQRAIRIRALTPLFEAIERLFRQSESNTNQELKIVLVSTVAGGTGSGIILPLAMYLKEYMKKTYSGSGVKINACLILPDVLESLKSTNNERDNLFSNGYAAMKEISYFMYKTDNRIKNDMVYINLPDDDGHGLVRNEDSPFDFCFLFGRLTMKKRTLGLLDAYKDAVAKCLYTQFIGSYSSRYFSVEDNMIVGNIDKARQNTEGREVVLSRFASANCFRVFYPYKEISEYLSLHWALDIMEKEWMKYDREVTLFYIEQQKRKENGLEIVEKGEVESYVDAVDRLARKEDDNAVKLTESREQCTVFTDQFTNYVINSVEQELTVWEEMEVERNYLDAESDANFVVRFLTSYSQLEKEIMKIETKVSEDIAYEVCQIHIKEEEWKNYFIEYYLKEETGEWKSPNEIRYFLCGVFLKLGEKYEETGKQLDDERNKFSKYKNIMVDIESSEELEGLEKFRRGKKEKKLITKIKNGYGDILNCTRNLLKNAVAVKCYMELRNYIGGILDEYLVFFNEYENTILYFKRRMGDLREWFNDVVQGVDRLVCTKEECINEMIGQMKKRKIYYQIGGEVSEWIYKFCSMKGKQKKREIQFLRQEEKLQGMWLNMFKENYDKEFNINLFEAFSREALYEGTKEDDETYIIHQLERAENYYSVPLLTLCRKDSGDVLSSCIYSKALTFGMSYSKVKDRYFYNAKAVCDEFGMDTDEKSIIFYQNRYGLESFYVDFFAYDTGVNNTFPMGAGYSAYKSVLERITGQEKSAALTPHIDKRWHRKEVMPDIDFKIEKEYIKWAFKALFSRYAAEEITMDETGKIKYKNGDVKLIDDAVNYYILNLKEAQKDYEEVIGVLKGKYQKGKKDTELEDKIRAFGTSYLKVLINPDSAGFMKNRMDDALREIKADIGNSMEN